MDTSEQYIKMCEKAKDIQKEWQPNEGDWYCYKDCMCGLPVYQVTYYNLNDWSKTDAGKTDKCHKLQYDYQSFGEILAVTKSGERDALEGWFVWLPRQDQLQEMVLTPLVDIFTLNHRFYNFIFDRGKFIVTKDACQFTSMEQLWLAFVMKEKYSKYWDGENWVKEK